MQKIKPKHLLHIISGLPEYLVNIFCGYGVAEKKKLCSWLFLWIYIVSPDVIKSNT